MDWVGLMNVTSWMDRVGRARRVQYVKCIRHIGQFDRLSSLS